MVAHSVAQPGRMLTTRTEWDAPGVRNRGVTDILIARRDGLAGFEDAICAASPHTTVRVVRGAPGQNCLRPVP